MAAPSAIHARSVWDVVQVGEEFPVDRIDRHRAEARDHEFLHQPPAGLDRARLAPDLDVLGQIALGEGPPEDWHASGNAGDGGSK